MLRASVLRVPFVKLQLRQAERNSTTTHLSVRVAEREPDENLMTRDDISVVTTENQIRPNIRLL